MRSLFLAFTVFIAVAGIHATKLSPRGAKKPLIDTTELKALIDSTLVQVATEYHIPLTLIEIIEPKYQTVSGTKFYATTILKTTEGEDWTCDIEIWDRALISYRHSTVKCGDDKVYTVELGQLDA